MGANMINQICEGLKSKIEEVTNEQVGLCILSNLVDNKLATAKTVIRKINPDLGHRIQEAMIFAETDPYRAATHNKGVLNGIDPILIATGNDWRASEAGIHAYACRSGRYKPITSWKMNNEDLVGEIQIPMAVGTVGGVTRIHPMARMALKIMEVEHADELARICAAVGLVQNLGALKALSTVGIVRGHMELHAVNLAIAAGSDPTEVPRVRQLLTEILKQKKTIGITTAREILLQIRAQDAEAQG
jgi:hydroxymethylglutaryl-CoA reductase